MAGESFCRRAKAVPMCIDMLLIGQNSWTFNLSYKRRPWSLTCSKGKLSIYYDLINWILTERWKRCVGMCEPSVAKFNLQLYVDHIVKPVHSELWSKTILISEQMNYPFEFALLYLLKGCMFVICIWLKSQVDLGVLIFMNTLFDMSICLDLYG